MRYWGEAQEIRQQLHARRNLRNNFNFNNIAPSHFIIVLFHHNLKLSLTSLVTITNHDWYSSNQSSGAYYHGGEKKPFVLHIPFLIRGQKFLRWFHCTVCIIFHEFTTRVTRRSLLFFTFLQIIIGHMIGWW